MSIIVAVEKNEKLCVAADTVSYDGTHLQPADLVVNLPKVRRLGDSLLGCVGYNLYENILDHVFSTGDDFPEFGDRISVFDFFLRFVEKLSKDYHFLGDRGDDGDASESPFVKLDSRFLIANHHGIFVVDSDITVIQYRKFWAIGSGCSFALGALHATYDNELSAREIAQCAAAAAIRFDEGCRGDVQLWELE